LAIAFDNLKKKRAQLAKRLARETKWVVFKQIKILI